MGAPDTGCLPFTTNSCKNSGWDVNGKRFFGSSHWKIPSLRIMAVLSSRAHERRSRGSQNSPRSARERAAKLREKVAPAPNLLAVSLLSPAFIT